MRIFFLATVLTLSTYTWVHATTLVRIHHLDYGHQINDKVLVYLSNGRVVHLSAFNLELMEKLHQGVQKKILFSIQLNAEREITSLRPVKEVMRPKLAHPLMSAPYSPSIIRNMETAQKYFNESMLGPNESQCFNRAQVWTHEWRIKHNLYSNKVWLFFTRNFIRRYNFEWWFHVSPMVLVVDEGKVRERVMDVKYARGPIKLKHWTDIFVRDHAACPVVEKYSDHANYPEWGSCFVMKSSMYYYQPADLELLEVFHSERTTWIPAEVIEAYREAFNIDLKGNEP